MQELTSYLGSGWAFIGKNYDTYTFAGPNGQGLKVQEGSKGRYEVRGCWTVACLGEYKYKARYPEITVAKERGLAVLAKEIQRRVLPDLAQEIAECDEIKHKRDTQEAARERVLLNLLAVDGRMRQITWRDQPGIFSSNISYLREGEVHYDATTSLELHNLSEAQALHILRYIHEGSK